MEAAKFDLEKLGESGGHCDCCGDDSRTVWGVIHQGEATVAAYWRQWTVDKFEEHGAHLDLAIGPWGDGSSADDRILVALEERIQDNGIPAVRVIDATGRNMDDGTIARTALRRDEVIGTPLAAQVFALVDAICLQDDRQPS